MYLAENQLCVVLENRWMSANVQDTHSLFVPLPMYLFFLLLPLITIPILLLHMNHVLLV